MPFTFAHPAIVLPSGYLPKRWVSLTGLVVGSLTPDFEYFFRWQVLSVYSHTLAGIFWYDLPVALALTFVFHLLVKKALLKNLPIYFQVRLLKFKNFNWYSYFKAHFMVVILSTLIGVASHVFWDNFTHEHGFFVEKSAFLSQPIGINKISVPVFKLLQHGSSAAGILVILFVINQLPADKSIRYDYQLKYWLLLVALTSFFIGIRFILGLDIRQWGNVIVSIISAGLLSFCLTPLILNFLYSKRF